MNDSGAANKVAQVTLVFWIMKICATTLGETAGDLLSMTLNVGYAISSVILVSLFLVTLILQLMASRFHPLLYWSVIVSTSTAGTTMSDYVDRSLGLGYAKGSLILFVCLGVVLSGWHASEKTISVSRIHTRRVELFYWIAVLFSNTVGTAFGDFLAHDSRLGFLGGASLVGGLIGLVAVARYRTPIDRVLLFWVAFVLTRPFGATLGDLLTKPAEKGGLDFGTAGSSAILAGALILMIVFTSLRMRRA